MTAVRARGLWARIGAFWLELLIVACIPSLLMLVDYFSWGAGAYRFAVMCALTSLAAVLGLPRARLVSVLDGRLGRYLLLAACAALLLAHVQIFLRDIERGGVCTTDMGKPSICAGEWLLRQENPWAECTKAKIPRKAWKHPSNTFEWCVGKGRCVDRKEARSYRRFGHHGTGFDFMDGYKYGPLTLLAYLPATHSLGERGIYVTNFVFWLALLPLLYGLAVTAYPQLPAAGLRALLGFLISIVLPLKQLLPRTSVGHLGDEHVLSPPSAYVLVREYTRTCANDVIPIVLVLCAVWLCARRRSAWAGVLIGLSMAAKQLPAPLFGLLLVFMDGVNWKRLLTAAVATTTLCYLPFFVWAPLEMIANLLLFNLVRPTNSSSIRHYLPSELEGWVSAAQLGVVALGVLLFVRKRASQRTLGALLPIAALMMVAFITLNKIVHGNYLVWVQPLLALMTAGAPFTRASASPSARADAVVRATG